MFYFEKKCNRSSLPNFMHGHNGLCIAFDVLDFLLLQPACIHNFSFFHVANKTSIHSLIYLHEVYTCVAEI